MDVDEDGDEPVATFDVVLTRSPDPGGALYVLQSPLRPVDRPYNLEACDGMDVKVRPGGHWCATLSRLTDASLPGCLVPRH